MSTIRVYNTMTRKKRNSFLFIRGRWASTSAASRLTTIPILAMPVLSLCGTLSIASLNMKAMM